MSNKFTKAVRNTVITNLAALSLTGRGNNHSKKSLTTHNKALARDILGLRRTDNLHDNFHSKEESK